MVEKKQNLLKRIINFGRLLKNEECEMKSRVKKLISDEVSAAPGSLIASHHHRPRVVCPPLPAASHSLFHMKNP